MRRALVPALLLAGVATAAEQPLKVLFLSGFNNHDWRSTAPVIREILERAGRFEVRLTEEPAGLNAQILAQYDVVVSDYNGPRWTGAAEEALESFVRSGKGLVIIHAASYAFGTMEVLGERMTRTGRFEPPWPQYAEMVGASWSAEAPRTGHGRRHVFRVKFTDREHPIARGMEESFLISDELYHNFRMKPHARILATAYDDPKMNGTGKEEPILWTVEHGKGRVFHTALGHDTSAMQAPGFAATLARGTEWAATGKVTLSADARPHRRQANPLRVQVVTAGHDFQPSFYGLFEDQPDITPNVVFAPSAYRRDLRPRTDVLVLYDMVQDISEEEKKNFQAYVEGGGGVVVLHHAIASYQAWPWYRDLVGGRYLLKAEGDLPASTYKHDVELSVEVAAQHPVTAGVGPLHIWDETYKGMWISPEVRPLLRTSHPTSDPIVAWVSPYARARVVYIQLGHDRWAHVHTGYRRLVRNAILWAGGRLQP